MPDNDPAFDYAESGGNSSDDVLSSGLDAAGITETEYVTSPKGVQKRLGKMAAAREQAKDEARAEREQRLALEQRLVALEARIAQPQAAPEATPPKDGVEALTDEQLEQAVAKIADLQGRLMDSGLDDEGRAAVQAQLANLGSNPGAVIAKLNREMARREARGIVDSELGARDEASRQANTVQQAVQEAYLAYGKDVFDKNSDLATRANDLLAKWQAESPDFVQNSFAIKQAFAAAHAELGERRPAGRQRRLAGQEIEGAGSRDSGAADTISALDARARQGDHIAAKKSLAMKLKGFVNHHYAP